MNEEPIPYHELCDFIQSNTRADCRVYEDYSGRGMYGRSTTGLVVDEDVNGVFMAIGAFAERNDLPIHRMPRRTDSLGLDTIIY